MDVREAAIVAFHSLMAAGSFSIHSGLSTRSKRFSIPKVITTNIPSMGGGGAVNVSKQYEKRTALTLYLHSPKYMTLELAHGLPLLPNITKTGVFRKNVKNAFDHDSNET
jgi:hypothetical protein